MGVGESAGGSTEGLDQVVDAFEESVDRWLWCQARISVDQFRLVSTMLGYSGIWAIW